MGSVLQYEPDSCTCPFFQSNLVKIGEDVSEQLDIEPARFFVIRHIRPQYACRQCETVTAAPVAPAVIDGSLAAPGLLAWVATGKYLDHLPLYRLEQIAARQQVNHERMDRPHGLCPTTAGGQVAELLKQRRVLHADETPVKQLNPGGGQDQTRLFMEMPQTIWTPARRWWCSTTGAAVPARKPVRHGEAQRYRTGGLVEGYAGETICLVYAPH